MNIFLGSLNIFFGISFLIVPIIFIEFARPRDYVKASLLLLIGIFMIFSLNNFKRENIFILTSNALLITILVIEIFTNRWNQLSEKEKQKLITLDSLKSKILEFLNTLKITIEKFSQNFSKFNLSANKLPSKKWIRRETKDSKYKTEDLKIDSAPKFVKATNIQKKDIIKDEKI